MNKRQNNATILILIGIILLASTKPLANTLAGSAPDLLMAGIYFLSPIGLVFIVLGIYRAATKGKGQ